MSLRRRFHQDTPSRRFCNWFFDHAEGPSSDQSIDRIARARAAGIAVQHRMAYQGRGIFVER